MNRYLLVAVTIAAISSSALAQPTPYPVPTVPTTPVPVPHPDPVPPQPTYNGPPGPAIPFAKSGGRIVGMWGYYPYDTGLYLLGETGVSRQAGYFTMVYPNGNNAAANGEGAAPTGSEAPCTKRRLFRR